MSFIDNEILNKIITSNDIVDIIGSYLSLIPKGKNYFCVCPFHDDHSPSMSVSPQKQIFRCFVCGETGNSISFLMRYLNISFVEAVNPQVKQAQEYKRIGDEQMELSALTSATQGENGYLAYYYLLRNFQNCLKIF